MTYLSKLQEIGQVSKAKIRGSVESLILKTTTGKTSALNLLAFSKSLEMTAKQLRVKAIPLALEEINTTGEKGKVTAGKLTIEKCETGTKYSYSYDLEWLGLQEQRKVIDEKIKKRQEFLRAIPQPKLVNGEMQGLIDSSTGELLYPPAKESTTSLKVTIR